MTNYDITIGYRAVITVSIKANSEQEAKEKALNEFVKNRNKMIGGKIELQDDNFKVSGVLDMDETWNMLDN
jgi:hypothetical protein